MAEIGTSTCRAGGDTANNDVEMAAHLHRDFDDDTRIGGLMPSGERRHCERTTASGNCASSPESMAVLSQPSVRSARAKKEREVYDPELEKLVIGNVQDLVQVQGEPQAEPDYVNGSLLTMEGIEQGEGESETAPAVPPRKSECSINTNTLSNQKLMLSGSSLRSLSSVSQPSKPEFDIDGEHDYINQDHLDSIMEEQETNGEVRPKESNGKTKDQESDEDDSEGHTVLQRDRASVRSTVSTTSSLFNLEPLKSSSGHKSQGPENRNSVTDHKRLGEFERRLLLAKQKGRAPMPSVMCIPWYHPGITRHIAECLLLSREIVDGTYLMRQTGDTVAISVRCQSSTRHYRIVWDGKQFTFGLGKFPSVEALRTHFDNKPIISGDSGIVVQLCNPYPRAVSEPAVYEDANVVTTGLTDQEVEQLQNQPSKPKPSSCVAKKRLSSNNLGVGENSSSSVGVSCPPPPSSSISASTAQHHPYLSINSMEGYLTKLGFHRKNWKRRWFVLYRNELKYFNNKDDKDPIKTINLEDATSATRDDSCGKSHCFRLVTGYRTFYMYAVSDTQANEWVQMLQWKVSTLQKLSPPKQ